MDSKDQQQPSGHEPDGARAKAAREPEATSAKPKPAPTPDPSLETGLNADAPPDPRETLLLAVIAAARHHGVVLDREELRLRPGETPSPADLAAWARGAGLWAKAARLSWRQIAHLKGTAPVVILFHDGSAGLWVGANAARNVVFLRDPRASTEDDPTPVDELRLKRVWSGEVLLIRPERGSNDEEAPFTLGWIARVVLRERGALRDISIASIALSLLTIIPPLLVMAVIDRVLQHHSYSTLTLLSVILGLAVLWETALGYARRELTAVVAARLDTRLNLHIFNRMLGLPLSYFERNPAGQTIHRLSQIWKVRDFMTGKLLSTFLDGFTLLVLLPVLFYMSAPLAWMVLAGAVLIAIVILIFLPPMRRVIAKVIQSEIEKSTVMVESVHGVRTVKSLAIEPQQRDLWDLKVANSARLRLQAGRLGNWPNTIVTPIERFIERGVLLVGAYLVLSGESSVQPGALIAFMLLGVRVAAPLVGMARLI